MATDEIILGGEYFMALDVFNTMTENEIAKGCPIVQVIYPSNKNSFHNVEDIKSRIESLLKFE